MEFIQEELLGYGLSVETADMFANMIMIVFIIGLCVLANYIARFIIRHIIVRIVKNNRLTWDDIILERKVFQKLSHIVPAIIVYNFAHLFPTYEEVIVNLTTVYVIIVGMAVLNASLNAADAIYQTFEVSRVKPIKGFIQVLKIVIFIMGGILIVSNLIGQNPLILLSGLGALSAVLMLVFKDSILGFVAGVQLATNDMVRVGDWIEMPKYNADGDVVEISLNTVKVVNWDKTITTIPSYALISDSFRNWRGMSMAGGRRIKRSVYIDTTSIQFCTEEMIAEFEKIHYLTDYVRERQADIEAYNTKHQINPESKVNGRRMTNVGVFRAYVFNYLKNHPGINQDLTLLVRQLAPAETGLPLEIYCFSKDIRWAVYEGLQGDIFDHIFAVAPEFGIRLFQNPTGRDLQGIVG